MRPILVTGGAGFIGTNLVDRLCREGRTVRVLDNLSRLGAQRNLRWLQQVHPGQVETWLGDVRDVGLVSAAVEEVEAVFHLAAQVAVTTSLHQPRHDFEVNAGGTLNVLEAVRARAPSAAVVFTSSSKVYGALDGVVLEEEPTRYSAAAGPWRAAGISEEQPLCFHSPYGCSKGAADQYVLDCARSYGLRACVLRMSCVYGPHQFGTEDQGWVAHFLVSALEHRPITVYGDGKQVRDVLYVEDLVEALESARVHMDRLRGRAFNLGGGPRRTTSPLELMAWLGRVHGEVPAHAFLPWRRGDQRFYVSDTRLFEQSTGWRARTGVDDGLEQLDGWHRAERGLGAGRLAGGAA